MATDSKSSKRPIQGDVIVQLIKAVTDAFAKLITTGTSTIIALGILVTLAVIIRPAIPEMQQQILSMLTGILGVIIGRMLASQGTLHPKLPETPNPSG